MTEALGDACGIAGSGFALIMFVPQALRCWRLRRSPQSLSGISRGGIVLLLANALAWAVYGMGNGAYWTAVPSAFNAPLAVGVLCLLSQHRRASGRVEPEPSDRPRAAPGEKRNRTRRRPRPHETESVSRMLPDVTDGGFGELGAGDGVLQPPVVGLTGDTKDPARHRHRHPHRGILSRQLTDELVHHFPGRLARAK